MASLENQAMCTDASDLIAILSSQGVDFLLNSEGKEISFSSLHGKTICLFFSANWCRPCKAFTPQLVKLYNAIRAQGKELEIVFLSFDHDADEFTQHVKRMPWLAVPFGVRLSERYGVDRIPSLLPVSPDGVSVDDDLIGLIEDYGAEAFPFTRERRDELKAVDKAKREGGKLEQILGRNYVISRDFKQTLVSSLAGKTVGLYFAAHWSPHCRAFTAKLTQTYDTLRRRNSSFEVVLVSTDRDRHEFDRLVSTVPWLAVPYEDRRDLCRIFAVRQIPAVVVVGPDTTPVSADMKAAVSLFGAEAFPFTEARVSELWSGLKREGEGLPARIKDAKHVHVLKLDMAKAYLCDYCGERGRFWAFSCDVCDYDLHPNCVGKDKELLD